MKDIVILGSSGHAEDILWLIENINLKSKEKKWNLLGFIEKDISQDAMVLGYPLLEEDWALKQKNLSFVCGIGESSVRKRVMEKIMFQYPELDVPSLISPDAVVSSRAQIGKGTVIFPGAMLMGGDVRIGDFVGIHVNSTVGHDSKIKDYAQINPGCNISGWCQIGDCTQMGTGVRIIPKISIGDGAILGAGAVVTKDIPAGCTAVGCPAKVIRRPEAK